MAQTMHDLAVVLLFQGDLARAPKISEQALGIRSRILGRTHPETIKSKLTLGAVLRAQGDLSGAQNLGEEALAIIRGSSECGTPQATEVTHELALTLAAQRELSRAGELGEEALVLMERGLGTERRQTMTTAWQFVKALYDLGEMGGRKIERHLLWLVNRDPSTLTLIQSKMRENLADAMKTIDRT